MKSLKPRQCFKKGTLVKIKQGNKRIEDIKVGDEVYAYNKKVGRKN